MPVMPDHATTSELFRLLRAESATRSAPAATLASARIHSEKAGVLSVVFLRKFPASSPGQANRYVRERIRLDPGPMERQVKHLQPTQIAPASTHMKTQSAKSSR